MMPIYQRILSNATANLPQLQQDEIVEALIKLQRIELHLQTSIKAGPALSQAKPAKQQLSSKVGVEAFIQLLCKHPSYTTMDRDNLDDKKQNERFMNRRRRGRFGEADEGSASDDGDFAGVKVNRLAAILDIVERYVRGCTDNHQLIDPLIPWLLRKTLYESKEVHDKAVRILDHLATHNNFHPRLVESGIFDVGKHWNECTRSFDTALEILHKIAKHDDKLTIRAFSAALACVENSDWSNRNYSSQQMLVTWVATAQQVLLAEEGIVQRLLDLATSKDSAGGQVIAALFQGQEDRLFGLLMKRKDQFLTKFTGSKELKSLITQYALKHAQLILNASDENAPWFVPSELLPNKTEGIRKFSIISSRPNDLTLVSDLYKRNPVAGYDIKSVQVVHNERMSFLFSGQIDSLEAQHSDPRFDPQWKESCKTVEELEQRTQIINLFKSLTQNHRYDRTPHVSFMPMWHGTNPAALDSLFTTGFANLASTDAGFFGKGVYFTADAEYAHRVYSKGALLINWVAVYSAFPVIAQDEEHLAEGSNFGTYDAHFVPVFSPHHGPKTTNYHACEYGQQAQYTELVVFNAAQTLPRYIVELQPSLIPNPSPILDTTAPAIPAPVSVLAHDWDVSEVCSWLASLALSKSYQQELETHNVTGRKLLSMTKSDWNKIGVTTFGDVRILTTNVPKLKMAILQNK